MFPVPIILLIFRRPAHVQRVVDVLAALQPAQLFVSADGPRAGHPEDAEWCAQARAVVDRVPWEGRVMRRYLDHNLGCGHGPASGISWAFQQVDRAIILEGDCLPHPSFFSFCEQLLERYHDDERVMHIAGSNLQREPVATRNSYYFSRFNPSWGWATWRRAWKHFDMKLRLWPELKATSWLSRLLENKTIAEVWARDFDRACARDGQVAFWDYQWAFACWAHSGLAAVPRVNLVTNIGCDAMATHTRNTDDPLANLPSHEMPLPLQHPPTVLRNQELDREFLRRVMLPRVLPAPQSRSRQVRRLLARLAPEQLRERYRALIGAS